MYIYIYIVSQLKEFWVDTGYFSCYLLHINMLIF